MAQEVIQPSFAAGELSPSLFGRVDLAKYKVGLALARNFFIDYHGGASNRPGTQYIGTCKAVAGTPRLFPFIVSTIATYMIEAGQNYFRYISNGAYVMSGGSPVETATPYAASDLATLKFVQSADVLTLTHPSYPPYDLTRTSSTSFALTQSVFGPVVKPPSSPAVSQSGGSHNTVAYAYVVTAVSTDGKEESIATLPVVIAGDTLSAGDSATSPVIAAIYNKITWAVSPSIPAYYNVYKVGPFKSVNASPPEPIPTVYGFIGQSLGTSFIDNDIAPDVSKTPPQFQDPFSVGQIAGVVPSGGSGYSGNIVTLTFSGGGGTGAAGYGVVDPNSGTVIAAILTSPGKNYMTAPTVHDSGANNTTYTVTLGQLSNTFPAATTYFQQRRTYGGTNNFPETFVASQPGEYLNFDTSPVSSASDAITASIASRQFNGIKSMVPMSTGLVIFTTGGAFLVTGGGQGAAVTPSQIVALPQASSGANDLPPLVINYDIIYGQNRGATIRDLAFNFYVQSYSGTDRSVLASHLFLGHTVLNWTWAEEPFRLIPTVRDDGITLVMTYVPEQEVFAWTHYDTLGLFLSVESVPEGQENAIYTIVRRPIGGTLVNYVERYASRLWKRVEDAWFLDAALSLPEVAPNATITLGAGANTVGDSVVVTASAGVFASSNIGSILWGEPLGQGQVTGFTDSEHVTIEILQPFGVFLNDPNFTPLPLASGSWTLDVPVTTISGLDHLDGMSVVALADGTPVAPQVVVSGTIKLPQPATKVVAGLPYQSQLQTLQLDVGDPTIQGKRKTIPRVITRLDKARGLKVGRTFDEADLVELQDLITIPFSSPEPLVSADIITELFGDWSTTGQLCYQQDYPLPVTILAVMPEVVIGDTGR